MMRTRPRLSGYAAKCVGKRERAWPARKTVIGKDKGAMRKRAIVAVMGVFVMLIAAGCAVSKDKQREEVTKIPVEDNTEVPEKVTPTGAVEVTTPAQEENSYELSFTDKEETEEATDGDVVYFMSSIHYPVFEGKYADNVNRFMTSLVDGFRETLPEAKENAKFDYEDSKMNAYGMQIFPEAEELTVSCVWSKEQYLVLKAEYYSNTGGAHPNVFYKTYVVDMTDGYKETFESMIRPYGVTTDEVVSLATERIQAEHGEELFPTDDENQLENWVYLFTQMEQWYFNENGLVLFANPYDIAAYAYGIIECEISYEELEEGLKK